MRLNLKTLTFLAVLIVVIIAAYVLTNTDFAESAEPAAVPTTTRQALFPGLISANVTAITITSNLPAEDSRPTPLPGNPPLATLTPVPEGEEAPTRSEILALSKDAGGNWILAENSTITSTTPVVITTVDTALTNIAGLQAESFIPASGDYEQFGLDNPTHDITFVVQAPDVVAPTPDQISESSATTRRLRIGNRTLDNVGLYAFLDEDTETVYIISNATGVQNSVLNMVTTPPFAPQPTATPVPILNVPGPVFAGFNPTTLTSFTITDTASGQSLVLSKLPDGFDWIIEGGDPTRIVDQGLVTSAFIDFASIQGASRAALPDLSAVGLDTPIYIITAATSDGANFQLLVGDKAVTATSERYYTLVNDFTDVVEVNVIGVDRLVALIENPPYFVELVPEITVAPETTAEAMAESTEAVEEVEVEATEAAEEAEVEATEEMTPEATETSD